MTENEHAAGTDDDALTAKLAPAEPLTRWMRAHLDIDAPVEIKRITTGASNELFLLSSGEARWVLRRPPQTKSAPSAHDVVREFRVLRALDHTEVPHPTTVALCEDLAVIGSPFFVMHYVDAFSTGAMFPSPFAEDLALQHDLSNAYVDALAGLALVDWKVLGLEGFGRPDGYLRRQGQRWLGQLERYQRRPIPGLVEVGEWLARELPSTQRLGVLHGDYHLPNVMFRRDAPARVAAIVDWEQSTIGDVLVDLGWLLALWEEPGEESLVHADGPSLSQYAGLATRAELVARYAQLTCLDLSHIEYYEVLALFKLACVLEGSYVRYLDGLSTLPAHAGFGTLVMRLASRAAQKAGLRV